MTAPLYLWQGDAGALLASREIPDVTQRLTDENARDYGGRWFVGESIIAGAMREIAKGLGGLFLEGTAPALVFRSSQEIGERLRADAAETDLDKPADSPPGFFRRTTAEGADVVGGSYTIDKLDITGWTAATWAEAGARWARDGAESINMRLSSLSKLVRATDDATRPLLVRRAQGSPPLLCGIPVIVESFVTTGFVEVRYPHIVSHRKITG